MQNEILTYGVTELERYPKCISKSHCKEIVSNDMLYIPSQKPDIECIESINVCVYVKNFKIIKTIMGMKLIIEGTKKYKVMYTADNCEQSVHSAHFERGFCEFILLDSNCYNSCSQYVRDVFIGIEDIIVNNYNCRMVDISTILIFCPILTWL
ncbi:MAG: DUF3794 domain-containing protein [Romboutsia sp.]|uniref:DUF3794 domain-containing protein n=1 Tax=Romboutsia sp. TaxID=1965302 RepID=UPI003F2B5F2A